jgi:hypothetical protein
MGRLNWRKVGCFALCTLPMAARAQTPFNLNPDDPNKAANIAGGTAAMDLVTVRANSPGVPLKHGNVIKGSERVQLGAAVLQRGVDYTMDYATGVVYIARALKVGDTVNVTYRYDKTAAATQSSGLNLNGVAGFKYNVAPGALSLTLGLGMTERTADGQVVSTNLFGFNNSFNFGQKGLLKGVYFFGERQKVDANSMIETKGSEQDVEEGKSHLIAQNLQSNFLGGVITADYQDVSKNFRGFAAAGEAGYNAQQLEKEKGLTRFGFGMKDLKVGAVSFGTNFKSLADGQSGIDWRSMNFATGGLKVNWNSQRVDSDFKRFGDIAEADRAQLQREAGISREGLDGLLGFKGGGLSFRTISIEDMRSGDGIKRRELGLNTKNLKINLKDQEVDQNFTRVASLLGDEQGLYGRELGLKRQWMALEMSMLGKDYQPIKFAQNIIESKDGSFKSQDVSLGGKSWSLQHSSRGFDKGFTGFAPLNATGEGDETIKAIANMYGAGTQANIGVERGWLLRSAGLERSFDRISGSPFKNWNASFESLKLQGQQDETTVQTFALNTKGIDVKYRTQSIGKQFNELGSLLELERQRLGTIAGLDRTDFALNVNFKGGAVGYTNMATDTPEGAAKRQQFNYQDKKLQISANTREVDPSFNSVNQLIDPEKDLLNNLKGFDQRDVKVKWSIMPGMNLDFYEYSANSDALDRNDHIQNLVLNWKPSKNTELNFTKLQNSSNDPLSVLFANVTEKISLYQNIGKYGTLKFFNETQDFDGKNSALPDFRRQYMSYETSVNKNTKLMTEQTRTDYDNGDKENISANTVSTNLNKRLGVSVTDRRVDRNGDDRDESNRNYGFWYDLGNGIQIAYGYARQLNGDNGTTQQNLTIGKNAGLVPPEQAGGTPQAGIGNWNIGGGYGENSWDGSTERTQAFSKMSIGTKKPFQFGFLRDVNINFGVDTAADYSKWVRENKMLAFGAKVGSNTIGYSYMGQMFTNGFRAVDRTYTFATDQSDKRWLKASIFYKVRTLPWDEQVMIRNFSLTAKPTKNLEFSHQMLTNPEQAKGDAILGSISTPERQNVWKLDYKSQAGFTFGGEWREMRNDQNKALRRTAGLNVTLFETSGSPLKLYYGVEENNGNGLARSLTSRYSLQFDQRAGPNQTFSIFAGNVSYRYNIADGLKKDNWALRMDYSLRF